MIRCFYSAVSLTLFKESRLIRIIIIIIKTFMAAQAGKKPLTKKIYFLQAPVGNSFCEHMFCLFVIVNSPGSSDRKGDVLTVTVKPRLLCCLYL